jgi:hypothetical protein
VWITQLLQAFTAHFDFYFNKSTQYHPNGASKFIEKYSIILYIKKTKFIKASWPIKKPVLN